MKKPQGYFFLLTGIFVFTIFMYSIDSTRGLFFLNKTYAKTAPLKAAALAVKQKSTQASSDYALGFESKGRVKHVFVRPGDHVDRGATLVTLDTAVLTGQLHDAEASIKIQKAKLDALAPGAAGQTTTATQKTLLAKRDAASNAFNDAQSALVDALQDAYVKSDDAIRDKVDQLYINAKSPTPQLVVVHTNGQLLADFSVRRFTMERLLVDWAAAMNSMTVTGDISSNTQLTRRNLNTVRIFLDDIAAFIDTTNPDSTNNVVTIRNWRTDISTARANISVVIKAVAAADSAARGLRVKLAQAEDDLAAATVPTGLDTSSSDPRIAQQEGAVASALAKKEIIDAEIGKMQLVAPIAGFVTVQNAKVGTLITSTAPIVVIAPDALATPSP